MATLATTDFNVTCWVLGGFITLFGLVSYLLKERIYLSEACRGFTGSIWLAGTNSL
jgi:sodium/hydrogen antiporter